MKITEKEFNVITGETTVTEREETADETQARLDRAKEVAAQASLQVKADAARAAAQAKLAALGLTTDDLAALGL